MRKHILIFTVVLALHLLVVFLLGIYRGLVIGNQTLWEKAIFEVVQFPVVMIYRILYPQQFDKELDGLWDDPLIYVIILNSCVWAFVITFIWGRLLRKA
jgi:hypothetical protein